MDNAAYGRAVYNSSADYKDEEDPIKLVDGISVTDPGPPFYR